MTIPFPSSVPQWPPSLEGIAIYVITGGGVALGLLLLLWGRSLHRIFLGLVGAGVGYLVGGMLAGMMNLNPLIGQAAIGLTLAVVFFIAARLIWALSIVALLETVASLVLVLLFISQVADAKNIQFGTPANFNEWVIALGQFTYNGALAVLHDKLTTAALIVVPVGLLPLVLALAKPRAAVIFATALLGGLLTVASIWTLAIHARENLWPQSWMYFLIPAGIAAVMTIIGWIYQGSSEIAAAKAKAEAEKKEEESADGKKKDEDKVYLPKTPSEKRG